MRTTASAALCDAIEIGVLQLGKGFSADDIVPQAMQGIPRADAARLAQEALGVATLRAQLSPQGYSFEATHNYISAKRRRGFDPYLFLLLGSALKQSSLPDGDELSRRFQRRFEDLVCWSLRKAGFIARVLSEPRGERGLPKALRPALAAIARLVGEPAAVRESKLKADDNDLDVDVVASGAIIDRMRSGRPSMLLQCTTSPVDRLNAKMTEGYTLFCSVWENGFYPATSFRGGATPEDLLTLDGVDWERLCQQGWVLDRMRLVQLAGIGARRKVGVPQVLLALWREFKGALPDFDWRNGWQESLQGGRG